MDAVVVQSPQPVLSPVSAPALLEHSDGTQEIDLPEGRPEDVGKIELAVSALPKEETRKANLAARPDDEIGVRQVGGVEIAADRLRRDQCDRLVECVALLVLDAH